MNVSTILVYVSLCLVIDHDTLVEALRPNLMRSGFIPTPQSRICTRFESVDGIDSWTTKKSDVVPPDHDFNLPPPGSKDWWTAQKWITCASSNELEFAIRTYVRGTDSVAELGAQLRDVSTAICEIAAHAVMIDVKRKFPRTQRQQHQQQQRQANRTRAMRQANNEKARIFQPHCFMEIDHLDQWRQRFLDQPQNYTIFVLDLNTMLGNDLPWTCLSFIREFVALFPTCRLVLVKSVALNQLATRLVHGERWIANGGSQQANSLIPTIVATVGVQEYRNTIPHTIRPGEAVLEVGCHLGTSTVLLQAQTGPGGYAIGIDVGPSIVRGAKQRYPLLHFAVGDAWKSAELLRLQQAYHDQICNETRKNAGQSRRIGFDVIYVDIGGLSGSDGLHEAIFLLDSLKYALEPRCIVIKSLCIRRLSSTLAPCWRLQKQR